MPTISCSSPPIPRRTALARGRPRGRARVASLAVGLLAAATTPVAAQGVVAGVVLDSASRVPVSGAQIQVERTTLGGLTSANGRFHIGGIRGDTATLVVRRIGYASLRRGVTVNDTTVEFLLPPRAVSLDQVVVTGTVGGQTTREIGNSVAQIDAAAITKIAPVSDFQRLLNGRAPDVVVMPGTGEVGTGAKLRVRGTSSIGLPVDPLIYIDGVRSNNQQATGPANQAFGSSTISRWNDIDPDDIERIDVLKGPSAATLYGTEASNGVINIVTKHGAANANDFNFTMKQGMNFFMNPQGRIPINFGMDNGQLVTINFDRLNSLYKQNFGNDIFRNGWNQMYHGSVGGGVDRVQYYASLAHDNNDGVEPSNNLKDTKARANLTVNVTDKIKVQTNAFYIDGKTQLSPEAGYGGRMWTVMLMDPTLVDSTWSYGFGSNFPWQYDQVYNLFQSLNRFVGGITVDHRPTSWFSQRVILGEDQANTSDVELYNRVDSLIGPVGSDALGARFQTDWNVRFRTADYSATARAPVGDFAFSTSVGGQYYRTRMENHYAQGTVFPVAGLSAIDATTQDRATNQDVVENATLGYYVQEQIGWKDRRFLTFAVRSDKNSAFGKDFGRAYYPKASLSWVLSDEPFFRVPFVSSFRVRAAYGQSGEQPPTFAALRTYLPVTGPGDLPAVTPNSVGNPNLGPERGKEFEAGFDAGMWDERLAFEFTYYDKRTTDAILQQQLAPSIGFSASRYINAGGVKNSGVELMARVTPIRNETFNWDATFIFASANNKVTSLGDLGNCISAGTYQQHCVGFPVGGWWLQRIVSAQLDTAGQVIPSSVMCDSVGAAVPCANAPLEYFGSSIPNKQGSFGSTFTFWNKLRVYGMVDFQTGQKKLNGNERIRCYFILGGTCRELQQPQDFNPVLIAGIQERMPGYLIQNASFAKLREVTVSYTLPDRWARAMRASSAAFSVSGYNLHTWTSYPGLEPEAFFLGGSRGAGNVSWEQTDVPQLSSFVFTMHLNY